MEPKVLHVVDGTGWSGTKEQFYLIVRELSKMGIDTGAAIAFQYDKMAELLEPHPVRIHRFENHRGSKSRFIPANWWRLKKIVEQNGYNVLVAHSAHAADFVRFTLPFLKKRPKVVFVRRNAGVSSSFSKRFKYSVADRIVVVSKRVAEQLREANFFPERLRVIESGVELSRFRPQREKKKEFRRRFGLPLEGKIFINVANWILHHKRQDLLLKAFSRLKEKAYLVLVGLNTNSEEAKKLINRFNLSGRVITLGYRREIPQLLNAADYFVLSSDFEGIAGSVLQAMATGKVVISTAAGGIPEYLIDGKNGFLVPTGDADALARAMERALKLSPADYRRLSLEAQKTAQNYSIEKTAFKYGKLFEELLKEN